MPKESRKKSISNHVASAKKNIKSIEQDAQPIYEESGKRAKHEALVRRIEESSTPYSKSHTRRVKRKAKEQLTGDMADLGAVLQTMVEDSTDQPSISNDNPSRPKSKSKLIGKGNSSTLTETQRKKELERERLRHTLILSNPQFAVNPFETIRTHARNTLIKQSEIIDKQ